MKRAIFILSLFATFISLMLVNFASATTTISTNTTYSNNWPHDLNSVSGVLFVPAVNQNLVSISKNPTDTAPFCLVFDGNTNQTLVNSTWVNNKCDTNNVALIAGNLYRIGTGANSTVYRVTYDQSYSPAFYPGIGNFTGGCYGWGNCGEFYTTASTMYSIESITLSQITSPQPPVLSVIGTKNITENQTLTIQLSATDPNSEDKLVFLSDAQTTLPSASFLNSTSGKFTWTPNFDDQSFYYVTFYVTDGQFVDYETVMIQVIDKNFATITITGNASIGNTLFLNINDPLNANGAYILSASLGSSPGIPLGDGRTLPLNNDWLFNLVLYNPALLGFVQSVGNLDSQGNGQVIWNIPNLPFFQNLNIYFSFVSLNPNKPGLKAITAIAPAVNVTIQ